MNPRAGGGWSRSSPPRYGARAEPHRICPACGCARASGAGFEVLSRTNPGDSPLDRSGEFDRSCLSSDDPSGRRSKYGTHSGCWGLVVAPGSVLSVPDALRSDASVLRTAGPRMRLATPVNGGHCARSEVDASGGLCRSAEKRAGQSHGADERGQGGAYSHGDPPGCRPVSRGEGVSHFLHASFTNDATGFVL